MVRQLGRAWLDLQAAVKTSPSRIEIERRKDMSVIQRACGVHASVARLLNSLQSPLLLAIRLYWGWQLAQSGWGKLHNLDRVTQFFISLNLPSPHFTAICISSLELFGGICLALGLGSRLVPLVLFVNMTVAYLTAEPEAFKAVLADPDKFTGASAYTFWFATLIVLIFGPGYLALDYLIGRRLGYKNPPSKIA
jgi:putative oxidoreductase